MMLTAGATFQRVVIALNWANIYSSLPNGLDWRDLGLSRVIAGGLYEQEFIASTMSLGSVVIPSGTDLGLFRPSESRKCQVAYMPRKRPEIFRLIVSIFRSQSGGSPVPFVAIDSITHREVASVLAESAIFLATSFREGLARPPIEAMACECLVVGFAGRGSLEYMDHLHNCYRAEDFDVLSAAAYLRLALEAYTSGRAGDMQRAARQTAARYSTEIEERNVVNYWSRALTSYTEEHRRE
jgi:hypothetical protein